MKKFNMRGKLKNKGRVVKKVVKDQTFDNVSTSSKTYSAETPEQWYLYFRRGIHTSLLNALVNETLLYQDDDL